ncbi:MAG: hypothetical protein SGJ00_10845 [bacterium]|nr:hypothetical protein [bacterium]
MKALLIDSNQKSYSYLTDLDNVFTIQFPPFSEWLSQDAIITTFIKDQIDSTEEIDLFIIPFSVTENYLEFSGLRLAHHIRLSSRYFKKPILFIGNLEPFSVYKLSPLSDILSTKSVYWTTPSKTDIEAFLMNFDFIELDNIDQYLSRVNISPPSNYESHHSIVNELALLQWSEFLQCDHEIPEVKENIQNSLYLKYIKALDQGSENRENKIYKIQGNSKILLIDDEAEKGWYQFYKSFLQSSPNIEFDFLSIDFKSLTQEEIISEANAKIEAFDPDVVLLDLRLCDKDFVTLPTTKPEELTGVQILKNIKRCNKGIQVIITTASNKAWNYQVTLKEGANGFVIKGEDSDAAQAIVKLLTTIQLGTEKARFLKPIYKVIKDSLKIWDNYKIPKRKNVEDQFHDSLWHTSTKMHVKDFFNNAFSTINNEQLEERFTISVILLYRIIEMVNEFFIIQSGDFRNKNIAYQFDQDGSSVPKIIYKNNMYSDRILNNGETLSSKEKCYAIYYKNTKSFDNGLFKDLHLLTEYRNNVAIHPEKRFKEESLEYLYENNFQRFKDLMDSYYSAVSKYLNSFN